MKLLLKCVSIVFLLAGMLACGGQKGAKLQNSVVPADKTLFQNGEEFLKKSQFINARLAFQTLIRTYPGSDYEAEAYLATGDSFYQEGGTENLLMAEDQYRNFINLTFSKAAPFPCKLRFLLRFLISPMRLLDDGRGRVCGLEVENNTLVVDNGEVKARSLGTKSVLDADTVIFAIGDRVDENLGLPVDSHAFVKNHRPRFPIDGISYEAFDPATQKPFEEIFVAGWAREASKGLVGVARRDGTNAARAVLQYLSTLAPVDCSVLERFESRLDACGCFAITGKELAKLEACEQMRARELGVVEFKFSTNPEMLDAINK